MKRFKISFDENTQANSRTKLDHVEHNMGSVSSILNDILCGEISGKRITVWGLTTENGESYELALDLVEWLLEQGAQVAVHDPNDLDAAKKRFGSQIEFHTNQWSAARQAKAVVVIGEHYRYVDPGFFRWSAGDDAILFDLHSCVEVETCIQNCIEHYTLDSNDHASIVRFPYQPESEPVNDARWQRLLVSSAG